MKRIYDIRLVQTRDGEWRYSIDGEPGTSRESIIRAMAYAYADLELSRLGEALHGPEPIDAMEVGP